MFRVLAQTMEHDTRTQKNDTSFSGLLLLGKRYRNIKHDTFTAISLFHTRVWIIAHMNTLRLCTSTAVCMWNIAGKNLEALNQSTAETSLDLEDLTLFLYVAWS